MNLERTTVISASLERVWDFFSDPRNLARLTPHDLGFEIVDAPDRPLRRGDRIEYRIRVAAIPVRWITRITEWSPMNAFADVQERGPYRLWIHRHVFESTEDGNVRMTDRVEYELPLGRLGAAIGGWWVRRRLTKIFDYRAAIVETLFRRGSS